MNNPLDFLTNLFGGGGSAPPKQQQANIPVWTMADETRKTVDDWAPHNLLRGLFGAEPVQ